MKKLEDLMNTEETLIISRNLVGNENGTSAYMEQLEFYDSEFRLKHIVKADTIKDCLTCLQYELNSKDNDYFPQAYATQLDHMITKEDSALIIRKLNEKSHFVTFMGYIEYDFFYLDIESMEGGTKEGKSIEKIVEELNEYYIEMEIPEAKRLTLIK